MAKKASSQAPSSPAPAEHVVTVREWTPHRSEPVTAIHDAIDAWDGRRASPAATASSAPASPRGNGAAATLDHAELRAKVDRLTKHVKARTVTVTETVTDLVEFGEVEATPAASSRSREPWDAEQVPARRTPKRKTKSARKGKKAARKKR